MRPWARGWWAGLAAWLLSMAAGATEPGTAEVERERIRSERASATAQFDEAARACQDRFAVTDCVNAARRVQRDTLASLRRQESVLEEVARRQRAAQRMADIRAKVSAQESRARAPATTARRNSAIRVAPPRESARESTRALTPDTAAPRAGRVAPAAPRAAPATAARASEPSTTAAGRAEREQARRAAFEAKAHSAQTHRDAARQRSEERSRKGKASQPLPQNPAASAP